MSDEIDTSSRNRWIGAAVTVVVSGFVFWTYHNQFWYAPDEGNYAHVAQRVLSGDVLNRDVQDLHMGYINFANAGWMWLFGERLLSLRYPLIAIGVLSALMAFLLTSTDSVCTGIAAALIVTTLSIVQFLNPTAHWYCFGLVWCIIASLTWQPAGSRGRLFLVGFLVGLVFLFRQLTGVIVAMGVLTYLLSEAASPDADRSNRAGLWSARLLCAIMFCGLLSYLLAKTDGVTLALYGVWPLAMLMVVGRLSNMTGRSLAGMLAWLGGGAILAAAPLVTYHACHGSIPVWLDDTVFRAESLTRLDFVQQISFPLVLTAAWGELFAGGGPVSLLNALFWMLTLSAAPLLGLCVLSAVCRADGAAPFRSPLIIVALFYGIVSLHYQIPIYLFYSLSFTLVALLHVARRWPERRSAVVMAGLALVVVGLRCHAAQPLTRNWDEILAGARADNYVASSNPRCGLAVPPAQDGVYAEVCSRIDEYCAADDPILALPSNAEIYFLSGRRNPFRFFNSALALAGEDDVRAAIDQLRPSPPRLVFFHPDDKYNTPESRELMEWVHAEYEQLSSIGEFEVYRHGPEPDVAVKRTRCAAVCWNEGAPPSRCSDHGPSLVERSDCADRNDYAGEPGGVRSSPPRIEGKPSPPTPAAPSLSKCLVADPLTLRGGNQQDVPALMNREQLTGSLMLGRIFSRPRKRPQASSLAASVESLEDRTLLSASGAMLGDSVVIDNGDMGFSSSGNWGYSMNGGYAGDHAYNAGTGLDAAQWTFSVEPGGTYQVAVTWLEGANRATDAPFTVFDGDVKLSTTIINQEIAPDDLTADGATWESIGEYTITSGTLTVRLTDDANEFVIADAVRVTQVFYGPDIEVTVDGNDLSDGGVLDLGQTLVGGTLTRTVTVTNAGNEDLLLEEPMLPDGFSLAQPFSATTLASGESTTFVIEFNGTALGDYSGDVSFGNNDRDEGPFNFTVNATVGEEMIIDNGDAGFSTTGSWDVSTNGGYDGDHAYSDPGDGDAAEWTFQVGPGAYEISTTWLEGLNRAQDATFTILDGDNVVGTVTLNQELAPDDFLADDTSWELLGQFTISSGTLTVRLTDAADQFVIADAVRITAVPDSGTDDGSHSDCVHEIVRDWQSTRPDDTLGSRLQDLVCEHNLQLEAAALPAPRGWGRWKGHPSR